ncbi:MAG: hypothetical protein P4M09_26750 [Devosia sp.]|nr:hypothetical protein [Devosia sp.]
MAVQSRNIILGSLVIAVAIGMSVIGVPAQTAPSGAPPAKGAPPAAPPSGGTGFQPSSGLKLDDVVIQYGPASKARGAPNPPRGTLIGPTDDVIGAPVGKVPQGVTPLAHDIFTTKDFYADRQLWSDPRYFHCMSPFAMEDIKGAWPRFGKKPSPILMGVDTRQEDAPWGFCDRDYSRENIVSPYKFKTAQDQYEALRAEAKSRGGPTVYTHDDPPPNWDGVYNIYGFGSTVFGNINTREWFQGAITQIPTYLSLLTPEYQQRFVQQAYHSAVTNSVQWPGAYCWPEGYMRRWFNPDTYVMTGAQMTQFWTAISETLVTQVMTGKEFNMDGDVPYTTAKVPQWLGDTVGFWDGNILVTWTSNIKGWISHGAFEYSNKMQAVEIYTPITRKDNGTFIGLHRETILYDPDALAQPLRIISYLERARGLNEGKPLDWRECMQTLFPTNGYQTPASPGAVIRYTVPDMQGRPWADIWAQFEKDMPARPKEADVLAGFK